MAVTPMGTSPIRADRRVDPSVAFGARIPGESHFCAVGSDAVDPELTGRESSVGKFRRPN